MEATPLFDRLPEVLTVSELTAQLRDVVEPAFRSVLVVGEITSFKRYTSGHLYFNLTDGQSLIRAIVWRFTASRLRFPLKDGLQVIARGHLELYPKRGDYSLIIDQLSPKGIGEKELALRELKEKLARLGYFASERKRPLPRFPARIAIVTSPSGAAVRDMLEILARRWPFAEIWIVPVRVQGPGAAERIAQALRFLNHADGIDVILLGRGGGSSEDLDAFNQEIVAQAIFASRAPIVSAVGHEIDVTLADMVADLRALTPSEAAERVAPDCAVVYEELSQRRQRLQHQLERRLHLARERLEALAQRRVLQKPLERLRDQERRLDDSSERLLRGVRGRLTHLRGLIDARAARLEGLSPLQVLARGYSLTRTEDGARVLARAADVRPGDRVEVLLADGRLLAGVERVLPPPETLAWRREDNV
jgi:exodeoxyribonuclease VII large subunit